MSEYERIWQGLDSELFRFATTERRELHIALLLAFEYASALEPALGVDGVRASLAARGWHEPVADALLHESLTYLTEARLLEATQDHGARYSTPEEFERRNLLWSLTQRGQAAAAGVLRTYEVLRHTASLQPAVLVAIADAVEELAQLVQSGGDERRAFTRLNELEGHHGSVVDNVRQFNRHLQRLLRDDATNDDVFLDVKRRTMRYLQQYVSDIDRPARRLHMAIERVQQLGVERVFELALRGANLAPLAQEDPGARWLADRARRWQALEAWFGPRSGASVPRVRALQAVARNAIMQLLRVLERRIELRCRSASVGADFRLLAEWFAEVGSEAEAHELFNAAFGAWPARHFQHAHADAEDVHRSCSWLDAPAVVVPPSLRSSGTLGPRGKAAPVRSTAKLRARRQARQTAALHQAALLREQLHTGGPTRLSAAFGELEPTTFAELLALLGRALSAAPSTDGRRRASTADGRVEIVLHSASDGVWTRVRTPHGELWCPDYLLQIEAVGVTHRVFDQAGNRGEMVGAGGSRV